ncbi:SDR family NAD(P)-dependent oxidoreductase [Enterobacter ludwigii]|uniref:SDR family NAD(P)-dependent oxidoreductase n=1 Tax=Enterobacter ludwigii TaxID=299767 RepID=UPI003D1C2280
MKIDPSLRLPKLSLSVAQVAGKEIAVIGGTGGLGRALAKTLAVRGARVTVVGRSFRDVDQSGISFIRADLSLMSEAVRVAALLPAELLDLVVFTTGIIAAPQREVTAEGLERDMAVSYLSRLVILQEIEKRLRQKQPAGRARPRVFIMGYPGSGQPVRVGDLNAEKSYSAMGVHMNTVAGNEMLVLDAAKRLPHVGVFGLNPGLIKTDIRSNFLGGKKVLFATVEWLIGLLNPTAEAYAEQILPLLLAPELEGKTGLMFNRKAQAILPSPGLTAAHIKAFLSESRALVARAHKSDLAQSIHHTVKEHSMTKIFKPVKVGRYTLSNRIVMAPMTRSRAEFDGTPKALAANYYAQRAGVGLIVSEGTQPSEDGQGYLCTPGIFTDAQVEGWKAITQEVHDKGSRLFVQLMHAGRMSHPDNTPRHRQPVAPSAIAPDTPMFTMTGMQPIPEPRALTTDEIRQTVADFRFAACRAIEAGADGVEIHGANAYLVQQFFAPSANTRTDEYGGSVENRARFAIEVAKAIAEDIGADRTAIRLSPGAKLWGIDEGPEALALYTHLTTELSKLGLAYVHVMHVGNEVLVAEIRKLWSGTLILNRPGRARDQIGSDVASGLAELESYGQLVLANPDFVERLKTGAQMNAADQATYYGGDAKGYTDYPSLSAATA